MVATQKKPRNRGKWNNVGLSPDVDALLVRVCDYRGWTKKTAVERMIKRELAIIDQELANVTTP